MNYTDITYETDDRLAFVTLNRPEKLNALSNNLRGEVMDAMREAEYDDHVGVIILRGAGRSFSAGYDLTPARSAEDDSFVDRRSKLPDTGSTHPGASQWARHVVMTNWTIWELAKPVGWRHRIGHHLRFPHRRGRRPDRLPAGTRHDDDGHDVGAMAPAPGQGQGVRVHGRFLLRYRDGASWLGQLRRAERRTG